LYYKHTTCKTRATCGFPFVTRLIFRRSGGKKIVIHEWVVVSENKRLDTQISGYNESEMSKYSEIR